MRRHLAPPIVILSLCLLLSACGFQLRGTGSSSTAFPETWKSMYLQTGNPNSEFSREILSQFSANGVQWADRDTANYSLQVSPERFEQKNLSLNSEARAAEFELTMSAEFTVFNASREVAMEKTKVAVIKQMENDPRNVVGKAEEVRLLKGEMRTELAQQIIRRIGFYAASIQPDTQSDVQTDTQADAQSDTQPSAR